MEYDAASTRLYSLRVHLQMPLFMITAWPKTLKASMQKECGSEFPTSRVDTMMVRSQLEAEPSHLTCVFGV